MTTLTRMPTRRVFLKRAGALALAAPAVWRSPFALAQDAPVFRLPELRDATTGTLKLTARAGTTSLAGGAPSRTMGYDADYLGPTLRFRSGSPVAVEARNATEEPVSIHWHGLDVASDADGGAPQSIIPPGGSWTPRLAFDQPAATPWYHTHVHGRTAPAVAAGLAGAILLEDDSEVSTRLPRSYGRDDFVLILQDKRFDSQGRAVYDPSTMDIVHGPVGDVILANGQRDAEAQVPAGPVRLRLINASTAATFTLSLDQGRPMSLIGTDRGLLPRALDRETLRIIPGERLEVVVDMSRGGTVRLLADAESGSGMGMGGMMGGGGTGRPSSLLRLRADPDVPATGPLPTELAEPAVIATEPEVTRSFVLDAAMGPGQMMRGLVGRGPVMTINGEAYDPNRIDFTARLGTVERWLVSGAAMRHPFHAHGVRFLIEDPATPEELGWKDVVAVGSERSILVEVTAPSVGSVPFMFHCHILEHEDAGMMGQFLVRS